MLKSKPAHQGGDEQPDREERCTVLACLGGSAKGLQFGGDSSESRRSWDPARGISQPVAAQGWVLDAPHLTPAFTQ